MHARCFLSAFTDLSSLCSLSSIMLKVHTPLTPFEHKKNLICSLLKGSAVQLSSGGKLLSSFQSCETPLPLCAFISCILLMNSAATT